MTIAPWKILESKYIRHNVRIDKCELANGKILEPMILEFHTWANVLALTKNQEVVLVRQYRHGAKDVMFEFPGGVVEEHENPLDGVKRELLEETSYTTNNIVEIGKLYPNPAIQSNQIHYYMALDAEKVDGQNLDDGEDIEVHLVPLNELIEMAKNGKFLHALQIAALFQALVYLKRIS